MSLIVSREANDVLVGSVPGSNRAAPAAVRRTSTPAHESPPTASTSSITIGQLAVTWHTINNVFTKLRASLAE